MKLMKHHTCGGYFANQLALKSISHPFPALFLDLLANWLLASFDQ